ncbi:gluconate 2-dehydrogenase, flavoprotein subunit [Raoultella ornithinolytica]|nr:gluconate 2-dehydrogenase, flavoprotein subunit [Raoultella ornithinolytica]
MDDFNADNFDHAEAGFVGGSPFWVNQAGTKPISGLPVPPGTPAWGSKWKSAVADTYTHHLSMDAHGAHQSYRQNYLDLDPNYKNVFGQPLLRMTFDWQENDIKMAQFMFDKMAPIAKAMKPKYLLGSPKNANSHFDTTSYQTTHMNGGAVMGEDPKTSAVNRYLQSWDVHNVFVIGASAFPQGLGYNPTGTVAALAYWSAKAIRERYLKNPGPLVQA